MGITQIDCFINYLEPPSHCLDVVKGSLRCVAGEKSHQRAIHGVVKVGYNDLQFIIDLHLNGCCNEKLFNMKIAVCVFVRLVDGTFFFRQCPNSMPRKVNWFIQPLNTKLELDWRKLKIKHSELETFGFELKHFSVDLSGIRHSDDLFIFAFHFILQLLTILKLFSWHTSHSLNPPEQMSGDDAFWTPMIDEGVKQN